MLEICFKYFYIPLKALAPPPNISCDHIKLLELINSSNSTSAISFQGIARC